MSRRRVVGLGQFLKSRCHMKALLCSSETFIDPGETKGNDSPICLFLLLDSFENRLQEGHFSLHRDHVRVTVPRFVISNEALKYGFHTTPITVPIDG